MLILLIIICKTRLINMDKKCTQFIRIDAVINYFVCINRPYKTSIWALVHVYCVYGVYVCTICYYIFGCRVSVHYYCSSTGPIYIYTHPQMYHPYVHTSTHPSPLDVGPLIHFALDKCVNGKLHIMFNIINNPWVHSTHICCIHILRLRQLENIFNCPEKTKNKNKTKNREHTP